VLLLTGDFIAGRAVGAGAAGGLRPGVLGRPDPPPFATARAAALSAGPAGTGRVPVGPGDDGATGGLTDGATERAGSAAGRIGVALGGRPDPVLAGRIGVELVGGEVLSPELPDRVGAPDPAPDGRAGAAAGAADADTGRTGGRTEAEPDELDVEEGPDGGAFLATADGPAEADVVLLGRTAAGRTRVVASSLPAGLSPGSLDFTSASVVIGVAPPPGICRDGLFGC
jgi:hypothetical protein